MIDNHIIIIIRRTDLYNIPNEIHVLINLYIIPSYILLDGISKSISILYNLYTANLLFRYLNIIY